MGTRQTDGVLQSLVKLVDAHAELTDFQLLHRFAAHRDEKAFAALLQRHGGLVYSVCRNILRHDHDAEDAFQGTFLVLARQAATIREENAVGSWLYRVAYRVAMKARQAAERRRRQENQAARTDEDRPAGELAWRELQAMLDQELNRLPEKYRAPFVLCCLTGKSKSEAAAELGWKEGTVSSRLAHARKLLQNRLARRGVTLSAVLSGLAIANTGAANAVPAELLAATRRAALAFVSGDSPAVPAAAAFAESVIRGMALSRLKVAAAILVMVGVVGSAAAVILHEPPAAPPALPPTAANTSSTPVEKPGKGPEALVPAKKMKVSGSVRGPDGLPVPGARVAIFAHRYPQPRELHDSRQYALHVLGEGAVDSDGSYALSVPQTTHWNYRLTAVAAAPGYAPSSRAVEPSAIIDSEHTIPLQLIRGHTARVQFVDESGQPVKRAAVHVLGMSRNTSPPFLVQAYDPPVLLPGWPESMLTDDDGTITLRDLGPATLVQLQVRDERFANEWISFRTGKEERPDPFVVSLSPPAYFEGRVVASDTGQPIPEATLVVSTTTLEHNLLTMVSGKTDADGRFRIRPFRGIRLKVHVYAPDDAPYLILSRDIPWPDKTDRKPVELSMLRGILVRGTITESGTGVPVPGASVTYNWIMKDNPYFDEAMTRRENIWPVRGVATRADGQYSIVVPPGPGFLLVKAAEQDYLPVEISSGQLDGETGGYANFPHAAIPLRFEPAARTHDCPIQLKRGFTLRGRVVGDDGKPVSSAVVVSPSYIPEGLEVKGHAVPVRDGRFELPGCAAGAKTALAAYDRTGNRGAFVELTLKEGEEPELRLKPCVSATLKFTGPAGARAGRPWFLSELLFRPGATNDVPAVPGVAAAITMETNRVFGRDCPAIAGSGAEYSITGLIPGAPYYLRADVPGFFPAATTFKAPAAGSKSPIVVELSPRPMKP